MQLQNFAVLQLCGYVIKTNQIKFINYGKQKRKASPSFT